MGESGNLKIGFGAALGLPRTRLIHPLGKAKRCVWSIPIKPFTGEHYAAYPPELIETPIKAGCPKGGIVLDPFMGSGTTALVAQRLERNFVGIDLNPSYIRMAKARLAKKTWKRSLASVSGSLSSPLTNRRNLAA